MPAAPPLALWGTPEWRGATTWAFQAERRFQLLALLALQPGRWLARDRIAALLWPDHEAGLARRNLRKVLHATHALPGLEGLEAQPQALRWVVHTDVVAFEAQQHDDPAAALAWRRGPPLQGLDDPGNPGWTEWLAGERSRLDQAWLALALAHARAATAPGERAARARRVLQVDPLDEAALLLLLQAEQSLGRPAEARTVFRRYAERLAQELGVEPARTLRDWVREHLGDGPAAVSPASPVSPQPVPAPPAAAAGDDGFVGRALDLAELHALLERPGCRLLTLSGPGGVGKSRLARQGLRQLPARRGARFDGGWLELPLESAADAAELPGRWAQALGLVLPERAEPLPALLRQWPAPGTRALLVLDNVEHLEGLAPCLQQALALAPGLTVLCTSRRRLGLAEEWVLPLAGLAVPDDDSRDLEAAASFDAVRLFERRATAARRDFTLAAHLPAVLAIVDAVGGLPLALELAASWVRLLPPEQIAADLAQGLELLQRDPQSPAPARPEHESLRAVLDGSWQLLVPREREALAALSVFSGGFTRAMALAVAGCSLPLLSALVDKSLVAVDETGRFALHPVVAAYAAERAAAEPGRTEALAGRLVAWAARALADPATPKALLVAEYANLRTAWQHAVQGGQAAALAAMAPAWAQFHDQQGRSREGVALLRPALALPPSAPEAAVALARLRHGLALLLNRLGELPEALAVAQLGARQAEACGERAAWRGCLGKQGETLWNMGRSAEALGPLGQALQLAQEDGDRPAIAQALAMVAVAEKALGRFDDAMARQQQALALQRELGDHAGVAQRLNQIGNLYRSLHRWHDAAATLGEGLALCRQHGIAGPQRLLRLNLGLTQIEQGELDAARGHLEAVLPELRDAGLTVLVLGVELGLARVHVAQRQPALACRRLQQALALARAKSFNNHPAVVASIYGEVLLARGDRLAAAQAWRTTSTLAASDEMDRQGALTLIERLALSADEQAALDALPRPTLEQLLARLEAEPAPAGA